MAADLPKEIAVDKKGGRLVALLFRGQGNYTPL